MTTQLCFVNTHSLSLHHRSQEGLSCLSNTGYDEVIELSNMRLALVEGESLPQRMRRNICNSYVWTDDGGTF